MLVEIFITNDNIVPDSGRQGLAAGEEAEALMLEIKRYFSDTLRQVYYRANKLKTALNKIAEVVGKLNNPDFSSATGPLTKKLQEHYNEFNKLVSQDEKEEINDIIAIYQNKYNSKLKAEVEKYLAPQKEPQEKTQDILDIVIFVDHDISDAELSFEIGRESQTKKKTQLDDVTIIDWEAVPPVSLISNVAPSSCCVSLNLFFLMIPIGVVCLALTVLAFGR